MTAHPAHDSASVWVVRPYDEALDRTAMLYLLSVSYSRGWAGYRAGADSAGRSDVPRSSDEQARVKAFLEAHEPVWNWLLEHADVTLLVDEGDPSESIWAWLVTSDDDVVHALGCKRSLVAAGLAPEAVTELAGRFLSRPCVTTLELPQMRIAKPRPDGSVSKDAIGMTQPRGWRLDPTWLLTRMRPWRQT